MGILDGIFKKGADAVIGSAGRALDGLLTNKEEVMVAQADLDRIKAEVAAEVNRHFEEMGRQSNEITKVYLEDVANARAMQIAALQQQDLFSKRYIYYLASFIIVSATGFGLGLLYVTVPEGNKRLVEMFADIYLFAGALSVIYFFFGSSKSSQDKTQQLVNKPADK